MSSIYGYELPPGVRQCDLDNSEPDENPEDVVKSIERLEQKIEDALAILDEHGFDTRGPSAALEELRRRVNGMPRYERIDVYG